MSKVTEISLKRLNNIFIAGELEKSADSVKDHRPGWTLVYKDEKNFNDPRVLRGAGSANVSRVALYTKGNYSLSPTL